MATATEYRGMSVADLKKELIDLRREQFNLRMQQGAGNLDPAPFAEKALAGVEEMEQDGVWSAGLWQQIRDLSN